MILDQVSPVLPRQATSTTTSWFFPHSPEHLTIRSMPAEGPGRSRSPCCWRVTSLAPDASQKNRKKIGSWGWTLPLSAFLPSCHPEPLLLA